MDSFKGVNLLHRKKDSYFLRHKGLKLRQRFRVTLRKTKMDTYEEDLTRIKLSRYKKKKSHNATVKKL